MGSGIGKEGNEGGDRVDLLAGTLFIGFLHPGGGVHCTVCDGLIFFSDPGGGVCSRLRL